MVKTAVFESLEMHRTESTSQSLASEFVSAASQGNLMNELDSPSVFEDPLSEVPTNTSVQICGVEVGIQTIGMNKSNKPPKTVKTKIGSFVITSTTTKKIKSQSKATSARTPLTNVAQGSTSERAPRKNRQILSRRAARREIPLLDS